jgi:multiple sugar transport system ATP-binding protein
VADIELINVSKRFGAVSVIENMSLSIRSNELMVFLGPSGCGKSTLLRMIAGLEETNSGEIRIGGERVDHLPPGKRGLAMVFQNYALYPHMKVRDNMAFGLQNIGMPKAQIEERIADAARILEIGELLDRRPSQLSGGQRQRVAIGRAIVKNPKAFLFDEPLSNLDAALRTRTRVELAELHHRMAATMIYVTHDQVEAMTLADRIVVLHDRAIQQIGTPMEVYSRPQTKFVAGFVGSPAMNFAPVKIQDAAAGKVKIRLPDGSDFVTEIALPAPANRDGYTLGIRPDAVGVVAPEAGVTKGKAEVVEQLGERTLVYVHLKDGTVVVAQDIGNSKVRAGDVVGLDLKSAGAHIFDGEGKAFHASA